MGVLCNFFKVTYLSEFLSYKLHIYVKIMPMILPILFLKILRILKHLMCQNIKRVGVVFQI